MKNFLNLTIVLVLVATSCYAQKKVGANQKVIAPTAGEERMNGFARRYEMLENSLVKKVEFRCIGPTVMSGRVVDIEVDPNDATHFFVAYASGGLWETTNNGTSFEPVFDHEAAMTIGDFAVDWLHEEVIWIGTGEVNSSRSSYSGVGVYRGVKSMSYIEGYDKEKYIWEHKGLAETHHIGRVIIHPEEPHTVWVAALGHLYTPNSERGIFKTSDGGKSWSHVLDGFDLKSQFVATTQLFQMGQHTGAVDLAIDPIDPNHLYAVVWQRSRSAWNFEEGGIGSAIYYSVSGGERWKNITGDAMQPMKAEVSDIGSSIYTGFPNGSNTGRIGLALHHSEQGKFLYAFRDNQNKKEEEEKDEDEGLKKDIFQNMSKEDFAKLDNKKLDDFLKENDFPQEDTAESLKKQIADGALKPSDLYDYLFEATAVFYEKPVIGAEVYRYDFDKGTWSKTHDEPLDDVVFSYGYYFGLIRVSPSDPNKIYIAGVPLITSDDVGATWRGINPNNVHVDHHALWINPNNPKHLINGSDGGVQISYDDGETWVNCNTPSVGQFYTVAVDDAKPYNVYGGLQDNGVWVGPSDNEPSRDWYQSGSYPFEFLMGGDGMQVQVDTRDNQTIYTGYQFGQYARLNRKEGNEQDIHPRHKLGEKPLRWNWQTPILLSKHHQDIFYICSNKVHRSLDKGNTFETLSGDLTRGEKTGDVPFATLTSISESPLQMGMLAVGSDDGLVHISKDNGYHWDASTSLGNTEAGAAGLWVSRIIFSSHKKERLFVTLNGYRNDHFSPYIYVSDDLGKTWKSISSNMPAEPVNVIREDFSDENILYVGTDHGLYITLDRGISWTRFACNMPHVPVHDIALQQREKDIVLGTHGRSIWIGDLEEVQQLNAVKDSTLYVFGMPVVDHRSGWGSNWSKWLEPNEPEFSIPVYSRLAMRQQVRITIIAATLTEVNVDTTESRTTATNEWSFEDFVESGINYLKYDLTLPEANAQRLEEDMNNFKKEDEKEVKIEKADNGKFYLPKGKYTVSVLVNGVERKRELVIE
ncbi:MAG: glycosyl hydrolase [Flavobacteriales bacterium]|nr:glycosyl hydrolase [Flavobacteriales bacterium]